MPLRKLSIVLCLAALIPLLILLVDYCNPKTSSPTQPADGSAFAGDASCQSCHQAEFNAWKGSDHFRAMLPPSDSSVVGDFNNATFTADGVTSKFFKREGKFIINTQGPDGNNHDYEVLYTFGHFPLQQYLVAFPGGRLQVPRVSWDAKKNKWFHQYDGQQIHPSDWLHWSRDAQNWNTMCASCHSTNLQKNYNLEADTFHTTWTILNVSCESCHGPGKNHIDFMQSGAYKKGERVPGSYLLAAKGQAQMEQINTCAPCHALKGDLSPQLLASGELLDNYIPHVPSSEQFHPDGQVKGEVYSYTSFLQSKMFQHGVKCSNCHNPHSGKVLFAANQLCTQCHSKTYDDPSHHFHAVNTKGAECKSCHMPAETFMGNDVRHDHSFRVPRPDQSVQYGTPNACNSCHTQKPAQWAADAVEKWYGKDRRYHFSNDLLAGSRLDDKSEGHLIKLLRDTAVPPIVQAAAATYLGSLLTEGSAGALKEALRHPNAQVRYQALRSLANFPPQQWQQEASATLSDKVRAVRIAAADLYLTLPVENIPEGDRTALTKARRELEDYLRYQADFSQGNVMIADHYLRLQDYHNASRFYWRGLRKDSLMNYARLNLSSALSAQGQNDQALQVLQTAAAVDPKNDRVFYNLALLYNEMDNPGEAARHFEKAVQLNSTNPRLYYNYGLLLLQTGKAQKAEQVLLKGLGISPGAASLNYALSYLYVQAGQPQKAKQYAAALKRLDPYNPDYQQLFQLLLP